MRPAPRDGRPAQRWNTRYRRPSISAHCGSGGTAPRRPKTSACDCPVWPSWTRYRAGQPRTKNHAQIVRHRFKTTRFDPAVRLLINHRPRRQIILHHPLHPSHLHQVPKEIERFAQRLTCCGACPFISVKYVPQKPHSSSLISLGYGGLCFAFPSVMPGGIYKVQTILAKKVKYRL